MEALGRLRNLFGLGTKEADAVELAITSTVYRQFLANAVTSGELEAAESKAAYLEDLCDNLNLDPEEAFKIHEGNFILLLFSVIFPHPWLMCMVLPTLFSFQFSLYFSFSVLLLLSEQTFTGRSWKSACKTKCWMTRM